MIKKRREVNVKEEIYCDICKEWILRQSAAKKVGKYDLCQECSAYLYFGKFEAMLGNADLIREILDYQTKEKEKQREPKPRLVL